MPGGEDQLLFLELTKQSKNRKRAYDFRNDPKFLRNQFPGNGRFGIPLVRKQKIDLADLNLIACTNTVCDDDEYFDFGVHFFVDDVNFEDLYERPEESFDKYSQYGLCCTPDFSVYGEMQPWRQIESVAHGRWVGAWWQAHGMAVVPTVSWNGYPSFDFCFDGIEDGCVVAIATYGCRLDRTAFLRGYSAMLERIRPEAVICYGNPFPGMGGQLVVVQPCHPKSFHRELPRT